MKKLILILLAVPAATLFGATSPLPDSLLGNHFVSFPSGASFPSQNLIGPYPAGYGGAFQGDVYASPTSATGTPTLTTVWCVDYQLDVEVGSAYSADIVQLSTITQPTDNTVRYGNQTTDWANTVTDPGNPAINTNTAAYRYALAAALVGQYDQSTTDSSNTQVDLSSDPDLVPTNVSNTARNQAIQEAIWYVTYNHEYSPATWAPFSANATQQSDYSTWVTWAEQNVATVNLDDWAVLSGPANGPGAPPTLTNPGGVYQTFLVQVDNPGGTIVTVNSFAPEPSFYWLMAFGFAALLGAARFRNSRAHRSA